MQRSARFAIRSFVLSLALLAAVTPRPVASAGETATPANVGEPAGTFVAERPVKLYDFMRYGPGCAIPGLPFPKTKVDDRLRPGDIYEITEHYVNGSSPARSITREILIWLVSEPKLGVFDQITNVVDVPGLYAGFYSYKSCPMVADGLVCEQTPADPEHDPEAGQYKACSSQPGRRARTTIEVGTFTFRDGRKVRAYRSHALTPVKMECDGKSLGDVHTIHTTIHTNEIANWESANFCGGTPVYHSLVHAKASGEIIKGSSREVTRLPSESFAVEPSK